jgi:U3 small nucleolar RNA-associated protein 7
MANDSVTRVQAVELGAAHKAFDVSLPQLGPYRAAFSPNGRYMAMAGAKGHLALTDWSRMYTACEVQVRVLHAADAG